MLDHFSKLVTYILLFSRRIILLHEVLIEKEVVGPVKLVGLVHLGGFH
jgi:hypothetical protein